MVLHSCDVTLTRTTYLNIVADQVHTVMPTVFLSDVIQPDNVPWHTVNTVQERFEGNDKVHSLNLLWGSWYPGGLGVAPMIP